MRGFLQRVAASATRSAPRMHPLVDSIYATPHAAEEPATSVHFESTVRSKAPQPRVRGSSGLELSEERMQYGESPAVPQANNRLPNAVTSAVTDSLEPLMRPAFSKSAVDAIPFPGRSDELARTTEESSETTAVSGAESSQTPAPAGIRARAPEFLPVVVERLLESTPQVERETSTARQATEVYATQAHLSRKAPDVQSGAAQATARRHSSQATGSTRPAQAEEIQIHIGRIEVLAVPQAVPRPAAAPARKGLNLDEYLSRRNGRGQ